MPIKTIRKFYDKFIIHVLSFPQKKSWNFIAGSIEVKIGKMMFIGGRSIGGFIASRGSARLGPSWV
jgi:hypothetical protein